MKHDEVKRDTGSTSYYRLHTDAVEDLVGATPENTPKYSKKELDKYRSGHRRWHFPSFLKVLLIKWWFYGAVCFFVFMGMSLYVGNQLDLFFVAAVVMGMVGDLLINHFLRFTEKLPGGHAAYIMVGIRGATGFFLNILYAALLLFLVVTLYGAVNALLGTMDSYLSVEPILFGVFTTAADMLCLTLKRTWKKIVADVRQK